jgi:hypothetical protein
MVEVIRPKSSEKDRSELKKAQPKGFLNAPVPPKAWPESSWKRETQDDGEEALVLKPQLGDVMLSDSL